MPSPRRPTTAWATARAAQLRRQAAELDRPDPANRGDWRVVRMRQDSARELRREAARFDAIASRSRA